MTKYRVIHIPSGEFFDTTDKNMEYFRNCRNDNYDNLPIFDKLIIQGCQQLEDRICSPRPCRHCCWNHGGDCERVVEEIEYLIEEIE